MRLTVGPLPPAVYWRRRAIVLGTLLAAVFLLIYSCGGKRSGAKDNEAEQSGLKSPTSATPGLRTPTVASAPTSAPPASAGPSAAPPAAAPPTGPCTDAELAVTVAPDGNRTEFVAGSYVRIYLKIKNISARSCSRDVGAAQQELRIMQGAKKVWSSDDCVSPGGSAIQTLAPDEELDEFNVTWNGRESTSCQTRPVPAPGTYQLTGRVGTKWSEPVTLTIGAGK